MPRGVGLYSRLLRRLTRRADDVGAADEAPAAPLAQGGRAAPGVDREAGTDQLRAGMEKIRESLRVYGAAIAALATAVLSGLGYATFHNLFPVPAGRGDLAVFAVVLTGLALAGSLLLVSRFFGAQRRIVFMPSRVSPPSGDADSGLNAAELAIVESVLREHAAEEMAGSARALELRALRLARVARRVEPAARAKAELPGPIQAEAHRLDTVLAIATLRAALAVLEHRSHRVFSGRGGVGPALFVTAFSVVGVLLLADYSKGERDRVALLKACAEAVTAGSIGACDTVVKPPPPSSPAASAAPSPRADTAVLARLDECAEAVEPAPVPTRLLERALAECAGLPPESQVTAPAEP